MQAIVTKKRKDSLKSIIYVKNINLTISLKTVFFEKLNYFKKVDYTQNAKFD